MILENKAYYHNLIEDYKNKRKSYENFTNIITIILDNLVKGCSPKFIIEGKTKSISDFAYEILKDEHKYDHSTEEIEDLSLIQILLANIEELNSVSSLIERNFEIMNMRSGFRNAELNSADIDLSMSSKKYTLKLKKNLEIYEILEIKIPEHFFNYTAVIQINTFLSYAWTANQYYVYERNEFEVPRPYIQELNRVASLLDIEEKAINNVMKKIRDYESSYGSYMTSKQINEEINRLELVYDSEKSNYEIAHKIAKLAMSINNMDEAIKILNEFLDSEYWKKVPDLQKGFILRDLGVAFYKKNSNNPNGSSFQKGQTLLKSSVQKNPKDSDAWASLGGSYKVQERFEKALECYKKALDANPGDPYPLGNYLILNIQQTGDLKFIENYHDMINIGISKRLRQVEVMVSIPWAFFDLGLFSLFLGEIFKSLKYYLLAIKHSPNIWMIETTLDTIENLKLVKSQLTGLNLIEILLLLGILFHPNKGDMEEEKIKSYCSRLDEKFNFLHQYIDNSIIIIAGGTDKKIEDRIFSYRDKFLKAFREFEGFIISGGTKSGISKIAGDLQELYNQKLKVIGYIPSKIPSTVDIDKRYFKINITEGSDFSVLEPLQYWYDIYKSGIDPKKVKLIGVNGGKIAAFEYRLAITFGAQVGIIKNTGRSADDLINDLSWTEKTNVLKNNQPKRLFKVIKNSSNDIYNFLTKPFIINPDIDKIQKILIQHVESGVDMYELNLYSEIVDNTLLSGFLSALDQLAREALKVGEILSIKFKDGYITGGFFKNKSFKVVFLLNSTPSKSLEEKIIDYIEKVETKLGSHLIKLRESCMTYIRDPQMDSILVDIFGPEILKFSPSKQNS